MTYYDRLNAFYKFIASNKLKPSSQLLYLHLIQINNELRNVNAFFISDRALSERTGLSLASVNESKAVLKNFALIDFKTVNHRTKYFFTDNFLTRTPDRTENKQVVEQTPNVAGLVTVPVNNNKEQNRMRRREEDKISTNKTSTANLQNVNYTLEEVKSWKLHLTPEQEAERKAKIAEIRKQFGYPEPQPKPTKIINKSFSFDENINSEHNEMASQVAAIKNMFADEIHKENLKNFC